MFGCRAQRQDKLSLPAGPNHCLLTAWLACFPQPRARPPCKASTAFPPLGVEGGTEWLMFLLAGRGPVTTEVLSQRLTLGHPPAC